MISGLWGASSLQDTKKKKKKVTYDEVESRVVARGNGHLGCTSAIWIDSQVQGFGRDDCVPCLILKECVDVLLGKARRKVTGGDTTQLTQTTGFVSLKENLQTSELCLVLPMRSVLDVLALDHLLVVEPRAVIADTTCLDGFEEGLTVFILLLDQLGVVVELVQGRRNGQQGRVGKLEHRDDRLIEEIQGNMGSLIDDDQITTGTTGRLTKRLVLKTLMGVSKAVRAFASGRESTITSLFAREKPTQNGLVFISYLRRNASLDIVVVVVGFLPTDNESGIDPADAKALRL